MTAPRTLTADGLTGTLDFYRSVVEGKLGGLSREASIRHSLPSGTTLLGVVKHLAWVEVEWFQCMLAGRDIPLPAYDESTDASFTVDQNDTPESILALYAEACGASREVVEATGPDTVTVVPHPYFGLCTRDWVIDHMIRETARHAGHLDILREMTDGAVGYA